MTRKVERLSLFVESYASVVVSCVLYIYWLNKVYTTKTEFSGRNEILTFIHLFAHDIQLEATRALEAKTYKLQSPFTAHTLTYITLFSIKKHFHLIVSFSTMAWPLNVKQTL